MSYSKVIDRLQQAQNEINELLSSPQDENHRLRLEADLNRSIQHISLLTRTEAINDTPPVALGPATTIAGKPLPTREDRTSFTREEDLNAPTDRAAAYRNKVEKAYAGFLKEETRVILNEYEDNVIRGVAKKAKMKVTKEDPEKITLAFIEEIKDNIRETEKRKTDMDNLKKDQQTPQVGPDQQNADGTTQPKTLRSDEALPNSEEVQKGTQKDVNSKGSGEAGNTVPQP
jgi:uncharacterized protein YbaA (DUF1428 family)